MIIYNSNKKFIGIDESDLKILGFNTLAALQTEVEDFADFFVKTPGHVHNFKHIHWIDFVLFAKSAEESKAIIHANHKNFKVTLEVNTIYLSDAPSSQAFSISLNNIRSLSADEQTKIAEVIDIFEPIQDDLEHIEEFVFDPQKTAEDLEMPVALIEEFIEDFISQAKQFKDAIYNSVEQSNMKELHAYSHKLKGVAANLKVNDALKILTKINKAKDFTTSKKDLDTFYKIITKLSELKIDDDEPVISDDFDMLDDAMNEIFKENENENENDDFITEIATQDYNKASAANEIGIDEESFNELFNDYIDESQDLISSIEEAINNNDADTWRKASIKLKGMSDNMRIYSFGTDFEVLITTKATNDAKDALAHIQSIIFKLLETKN